MKYLGKITDNKDLVTKEYVDIIPYGVCDTASGTVGKTVTLNKTISLTTGTVIYVKFNNANSVANPTLDVNTLGAKSIVCYDTTAPGTNTNTSWFAGNILSLVYDGTNWVMENGNIATTTYYGLTKLSSATDSTSTSLAATPSAVKAAYDLATTANDKVLIIPYGDTSRTPEEIRALVQTGEKIIFCRQGINLFLLMTAQLTYTTFAVMNVGTGGPVGVINYRSWDGNQWSSGTSYIGSFGYPVVTTLPATVAWNTEYRLSSALSALSFTMPVITAMAEEVRIVFQASADITAAITVPSGVTLYGAGDISITSGNRYEMTIACIGPTHMAVVCKEWS